MSPCLWGSIRSAPSQQVNAADRRRSCCVRPETSANVSTQIKHPPVQQHTLGCAPRAANCSTATIYTGSLRRTLTALSQGAVKNSEEDGFTVWGQSAAVNSGGPCVKPKPSVTWSEVIHLILRRTKFIHHHQSSSDQRKPCQAGAWWRCVASRSSGRS